MEILESSMIFNNNTYKIQWDHLYNMQKCIHKMYLSITAKYMF